MRLLALSYPDYSLGPRAAELDSSFWNWLESHPLAHDMHRWVLLTGEGEIVGHLAATAQYYRINGERVVAHTPADYMVLSRYGFHAFLLMRQFFRNCQNCVTCDVEQAVIKVETRLGAQEAGRLQFAVKVWDVSGLPNVPASVPRSISKFLNWGLRAADRALSGTLRGDDLKVEVLEGFDESFDELFEKIASEVPCLPEKDSTFLRWRYGPDSPQAPLTILGIRGEEGILGYAVLKVTGDGRDGYLLDLTTVPGRHDVARTLLREAIRYFRQAGVSTVRYRFLKSPTSPRLGDLWRLGLFLRSKRRHALLVKFADRALYEAANDAARWSYSVGDGEASFWIR